MLNSMDDATYKHRAHCKAREKYRHGVSTTNNNKPKKSNKRNDMCYIPCMFYCMSGESEAQLAALVNLLRVKHAAYYDMPELNSHFHA